MEYRDSGSVVIPEITCCEDITPEFLDELLRVNEVEAAMDLLDALFPLPPFLNNAYISAMDMLEKRKIELSKNFQGIDFKYEGYYSF